jgi:kynureninase
MTGPDLGGTAAETETGALALDAADPLTALRDRFLIPAASDGTPAVYYAGQSLGLQPRTVRAAIETQLDAWARLGVDAWFAPDRPWFTMDDALRAPMARVVGASPAEVGLMLGLTADIHLLLTSFFRPAGARRRILTDGPLFPSDRHALVSHLAARGLDPDADLVVVGPRSGEATVRTDDLELAIAEHGPSLAVVFLAGVNFATGQAHDIERLTAAGHAAGATVGWDLAHAAGNIELALHDWDVDFAAWCTYKYLNGGPGSVASIFVHERHGRDRSLPRLGGWWGIDPDHRFDLDGPFVPAEGAAGWSTSTSPILSLAALAASLAIFDEIGMPHLRRRSVALTGDLERRLRAIGADILTPADPAARGAQLSIRVADPEAVLAGLAARGVIADIRAPDIVRLAPMPLYNTFHEGWRVAGTLADLL